MANSEAETAGAQTAAIVENAIAATETAVDAANERADAAEQAAALVLEGVAARAIVERVDDCEQGLSECHQENESLQQLVETLESRLTATAANLTALEAKLEAMPKITLAPEPSLSIPTNSPAPVETVPLVATVNPENNQDADAGAPPEAEIKPKRYRVT